MMEHEPLGLYIDGAYVDATSGETFPTVNPATGAVIREVQQASDADVDAAVRSARAGFETWRSLTGAAARPGAERGGAPAAGPQPGARRAGGRRHRQADRRGDRRRRALRGRLHRVLRRRRGDAPRLARRPRLVVGLHPAGAARRLRRDRRVELPDPDRVLEVGAGARLRERDGVQAGRAHAR